jgi:hypothetical protein
VPFTFNSHAKTQSLARWLLTIGVPLALSLAMGAVQAQTWPTKTVKIVVPFAPGGASDILALKSVLGPIRGDRQQTRRRWHAGSRYRGQI